MKGAIFMPKIIEKTSKNGVITAFSDGLGVYRYSYVADKFRILDCNHEDFIQKSAFIDASEMIICLPDVGYYYRFNPESLTHRKLKNEDYMYYEDAHIFCENMYERYTTLKEECDYFQCWVLLWIVTELNKNKECRYLSIYGKAMEELKKHSRIYLTNKYFGNDQKLIYILLRFGGYRMIYQVYHKVKKIKLF
jgi:hypothetical protein